MEDAYVIFRIKSNLYALPSSCIKEVMRMKEVKVHKLPVNSNLIKGMVNLRGIVFPVLCGKALLKVQGSCEELPSRVIVVSHGGSFYGLIVDSIMERIILQEGQLLEDSINLVNLEDCLRWCIHAQTEF